MGHLVDAFKKLEQKRSVERPKPGRRAEAAQRAAMRPKPVRLPPAGKSAVKAWRIDEPHPTAAAHVAVPPARPLAEPTAPPAEAILPAPAQVLPTPALPMATRPIIDPAEFVPRNMAAALSPVKSSETASASWQIPFPHVAAEFHDLAARLLADESRVQRPYSILLTEISPAAKGVVSSAALAVALSAHGSVLWINTQDSLPTAEAIGPPIVQLGWSELEKRQATWDQVIAATNLPGVSFVGCGQEKPLARLTIDERVFEPIAADFSIVLVEGGSLEAAWSFAAVTSVTGLIVPLGDVRRSELETALQRLAQAGGSPPVIVAV